MVCCGWFWIVWLVVLKGGYVNRCNTSLCSQILVHDLQPLLLDKPRSPYMAIAHPVGFWSISGSRDRENAKGLNLRPNIPGADVDIHT